MDTRTGELFGFKNQQELDEAKKNNPFLVEVDYDLICDFREKRNEKTFCIANRMQRRLIKCQIKRKNANSN